MSRVIRVYTDGSCSENPGPGGWAAVFELDGEVKVLRGHDCETTNNRMELRAVIEAMRRIVSKKVKALRSADGYEIHSDSAYVVNAVCKGWVTNWERQGWRNGKGDPTKNKDMWIELQRLMAMASAAGVSVTFKKVRGHAGEPLNELADSIAVAETEKAKIERTRR